MSSKKRPDIKNDSFERLFADAEATLEYWVEGAIIDFTEEMLRFMEENKINRSALAKLLDVKPSYVTKILKGDDELTVQTIAKIASVLGGEVTFHFKSKNSMDDCLP